MCYRPYMNKKIKRPNLVNKDMIEHFGILSISLLTNSPVEHAWRINFLANFLVGPVYRVFGDRFDLSRYEFVVLFCLSQHPGLVARDVCLLTGLPKNSISRAITLLLNKNLINREAHAQDKRAKTLAITIAGTDLLAKVLPYFEERQSQMRAVLSSDELAQFDKLLLKVIFAMPSWVELG